MKIISLSISPTIPPSPDALALGEGGAKRRMRAGAHKRDGGASGKVHLRASGNTAPLCYAALIRPSGTFSQRKRVGRRGNLFGVGENLC